MTAPEPSRRGIAARLSFFYAAIFSVIGIHLPFFPLWLQSRGMGPAEIGVLLSAVSFVRVVTTPTIGTLADRLGERRRPMILLTSLALLCYCAYWAAEGFWMLLVIGIAAGVSHAAVMPLGETVTMAAVARRGLDYGRLRLWGSLAFIACSAGGGWLLDGRPIGLVIAMLVATVALMLLAIAFLPEPPLAPAPAQSRAVGRILGDPRFALLLASCGALQASHAVYYALATVDWKRSGFDELTIGLLSAEAVAAEVALFALGAAALQRLGPTGLLILSGAAGTVRWLVMSSTSDLAVLSLAQLLHAFTFGAAHLGAMHIVQRLAPPGLAASAQSLYSAIGMGLTMGAALLASGPLYARYGSGAYVVMAGLSAAGLVGSFALTRLDAMRRR
ncbi:MAG: MFS transporter [Alphaproteobacteria bacterium]